MTEPLDLRAAFAPELVEALEQLVDERVAAALEAARTRQGTPWLTLAEAAEHLRISQRKLNGLLKQGRVHSAYIGRRRLVHRDDLDLFLRAEP